MKRGDFCQGSDVHRDKSSEDLALTDQLNQKIRMDTGWGQSGEHGGLESGESVSRKAVIILVNAAYESNDIKSEN